MSLIEVSTKVLNNLLNETQLVSSSSHSSKDFPAHKSVIAFSQTGSVEDKLYSHPVEACSLSNSSRLLNSISQSASVTLKAPSALCVTPAAVSVSVAQTSSAGAVTGALQPHFFLDPMAAEVRSLIDQSSIHTYHNHQYILKIYQYELIMYQYELRIYWHYILR